MCLRFSLIFLFNLFLFGSSFSKGIKIIKNISYINSDKGTSNLLDIYYPEKTDGKKDVLVFIHGGSWNSGKKDTYWWLGRNFANKNIVEVNISYSISPDTQYPKMAADAASALKWVKNNIGKYGGNSNRIFVMGHSAGGHLAALINSDPQYFHDQNIQNPIYGVILNDGFGLDMYEYLLKAEKNTQTAGFMKTFDGGEEAWKKGSPLTYFDNINNPYLILVGEKTYPAIQIQSKRLYELLVAKRKPVFFKELKNKKHIGMISQMIFRRNKSYQIILDFMSLN
ncbi:MAG: alpha/beta hydrolase [Flavobacterium sp.]|nr:alpha/beta hydrolase [Pedobacter sp.]